MKAGARWIDNDARFARNAVKRFLACGQYRRGGFFPAKFLDVALHLTDGVFVDFDQRDIIATDSKSDAPYAAV